MQEQQKQGRPHQVELLLDRQRPRVLERRRRRELGEVRLVGEDQMPVVDIEQRGEGFPPESGQVDQAVGARAAEGGIEEQVQRERRDHQEESRQQPPSAPAPERDEVDTTRADPFLEQQRGDEETGEDEEQVDAEVATRGPTQLEVVRDHDGHGDAAQTGQCRQVAAGDRSRPARVSLLAPLAGRTSVAGDVRQFGQVGHAGRTRSRRHSSSTGSPVPSTSRSTSAATVSSADPDSLPVSVRSRASRGLARPGGRGRFTAPGTG